VSGKASFEILWCDFTVRIDKTLVDGEKPPLPPAVDVIAELNRVLSNAQSWSTQAPAFNVHGVALRRLAPGASLVVDPLGRLVVKQQVVPLNTSRDVDMLGGSPVRGLRRFSLVGTLNGQVGQSFENVRDSFAPAQFFRLSDAEKLTGPSFDEMDAGLVFGSEAVSFDAAQGLGSRVRYKSINTDAPSASGTAPKYELNAAQLEQHARSGAAGRASVRQVGIARFRNVQAKAAVQLQATRWSIQPLTVGAAPSVAADVKTWSEHRAVLTSLNRASGGRYQIVPTYELTP
jgi:hypothetical protein